MFDEVSLKDSTLFFYHQYGFDLSGICWTGIKIYDYNPMDQNELPINAYVYLFKTFDTIDHLILIDKLKYYCINGTNLIMILILSGVI